MEKITLEEFKKIKNEMIQIITNVEEFEEGKVEITEEEAKKILERFLSLQNKLLSYDLSDIQFEEWRGLSLISEEKLDFSQTHANIDFSLLHIIQFDSIDLKGCNIKGVQYIEFDEDTFDSEFISTHPEYFPDDSLPDEIKRKFYNHELQFNDILNYPSLKKCVNENSFKGYNQSEYLIEAIGFENAMKMFDEYPEFINFITYEDENIHDISYQFNLEKSSTNMLSYEDAKNIVYDMVINDIKETFGLHLPDPEIIPKEMIEKYPKIFLTDSINLPPKVIEDFKKGNLTLRQIRYYSDILKEIDIDFGIRSSYIKRIKNYFNSIWEYIEKVPQEYDRVIIEYISRYYYDKDNGNLDNLNFESLEEMLPKIIHDSIENRSRYSNDYNIDEYYAFSKYIPIEELYKDESIIKFIQKYSFENIYKFNLKYNKILEYPISKSYSYSYPEESFLSFFAKYIDYDQNELIENKEQLLQVLSDIIYKIRNDNSNNDNNDKHILQINSQILSTIFKDQFLNYEMLDELLGNVTYAIKQTIISRLEDGINGNSEKLLEVVQDYPELIPAVQDVKIVFTTSGNYNNILLREVYQKIGNKNFLEVISKYGTALIRYIASLSDEKFDEFLLQLTENNIENENVINNHIYKYLRKKSKRQIDIRKLPVSFKESHPELYISEDAPEELKRVFYGKQSYDNSITELLNESDIQNHPEWIPYLRNIDLSMCIEYKEAKCIDNDDISSTDTNYTANMYEILLKIFSQDEILQILSQYGESISKIYNNNSCYYKFDLSKGKEENYNIIIEGIYEKIISRGIYYSTDTFPLEFKEKYPELFIDELAPSELEELFYKKKITPALIQSHQEWIEFLKEKNLSVCSDNSTVRFVYQCQHAGLNNEQIFTFFIKYGDNLIAHNVGNFINVNSKKSMEEFDEIIKQEIIKSIYKNVNRYDESLKSIIGEEHPELFLDEDAPEELKEHFYNYSTSTPLTFELLREHKEWLPYIKEKQVLLSLKKKRVGINGLSSLFEKYGQDEALKIGMKNPESVMEMLSEDRFTLLSEWYDKLHYVPHHVVMRDFPIEESDKFASSTKKWGQLTKIERHNLNDDSKAAILKASMCFGVFDNDDDGFNKVMELFAGLPKKVSDTDMKKIIYFLNNKEDETHEEKLLLTEEQETKLEELKQKIPKIKNPEEELSYNEQLLLFKLYYKKDENGNYILRYNPKENKNIVRLLRNIIEDTFEIDIIGDITDVNDDLVEDIADGMTEDVFEDIADGMTEDVFEDIADGMTEDVFEGIADDISSEFGVSTILTADKAHKLFGGFEMIYKPDFRDFILENMDIILSSSDYIAYISSMQKQWEEIKAINSNRVLTLDLALAYVKSHKYNNVEIGNERLAEVSNMAGYSQNDFEELQKIYNYGKIRVFSSIPRINVEDEEYKYEILRLDNPLATAIGTLTDCCQELGNAAESCMENSMVSKHGRVFVICDKLGNIVAQSWVWRNKNVICFDNIEIPDKAFKRAEEKGISRSNFADIVFNLYQKAAKGLMDKDEAEYKKLLDEGKITEDEFEKMKLAKVTVGMGFNDIRESLERNSKIDKSSVARPPEYISPISESNYLYTSDSEEQYIIAGEETVPQSNYEALTIYSDEYKIYDDTNIKSSDVITLKQLEYITNKDNCQSIIDSDIEENIVTNIAYSYYLKPETTRIIMNANFAIIYEVNDNDIKIADIFYNNSTSLNNTDTDTTDTVIMQIRMAIEQINPDKKEFVTDSLNEEQLEIFNKALVLSAETIDEERGLKHGTR